VGRVPGDGHTYPISSRFNACVAPVVRVTETLNEPFLLRSSAKVGEQFPAVASWLRQLNAQETPVWCCRPFKLSVLPLALRLCEGLGVTAQH
jgi:hypothetical protein